MKRYILILGAVVFLGLTVAQPVFAIGCCRRQDSPNVALTETRKSGTNVYDAPITTATSCTQKGGVWLPDWETAYVGFSILCQVPPGGERPLDIGDAVPVEVKQKAPLIFIPQVEIPGLFGGEIVIGNQSIGQYIAAFYMFFVSISGVFAIAMVLLGGFKRITAAGNSSKVQDGSDMMNSALSGIVLLMLSYLLLNLINPTLTTLAGFQLNPIKPILLAYESQGEAIKDASVCGVKVNPSTGVLENFNDVPDYDAILKQAGQDKGVMPSLLKAVMLVESCGNPNAIGRTKEGKIGGCGLMQVNPVHNKGTCDGLITPKIAESDSTETKQAKLNIITANINKGAEILANAYRATCPDYATTKKGAKVQCDHQKSGCKVGEDRYAIAAYNAGTGANCSSADCVGLTWWECSENVNYAETRKYVQSVDAAHNTIRNKDWVPK